MGFLEAVFGKKQPKLTDPSELVRKEDLLNRANIVSPYGGRTISTGGAGSKTLDIFGGVTIPTGGEGRTTVEITETPLQKSLRELQGQRATEFFGGSPATDRSALEKAMFERSFGLIEPERERERRELETGLSLKGIPIGSEGYQREQERLGTAQSEELRQLALQAFLGAGAESRLERAQGLSEISPFLQTQAQEQGFLQGLTDLQPINVSGIYQQSDILKQNRNIAENARRKQRFDMITGAIATAFTPAPAKGAAKMATTTDTNNISNADLVRLLGA